MSVSISRSFNVAVVAAAIIILWVGQVQAKRGCTAFGHSCFGGHGKRSDSEMPDPMMRIYDSQEATPVDLTNSNDRQAAEAIMRGYDPRLQVGAVIEKEPRTNLGPLLMKWLQRYRLMHLADTIRPNEDNIE